MRRWTLRRPAEGEKVRDWPLRLRVWEGPETVLPGDSVDVVDLAEITDALLSKESIAELQAKLSSEGWMLDGHPAYDAAEQQEAQKVLLDALTAHLRAASTQPVSPQPDSTTRLSEGSDDA